jgi:hypothetical protein
MYGHGIRQYQLRSFFLDGLVRSHIAVKLWVSPDDTFHLVGMGSLGRFIGREIEDQFLIGSVSLVLGLVIMRSHACLLGLEDL